MKLLNRLLRKEEVRRGDGSIYLNRWTLFRSKPKGLFSLIGLGDIRIYIHEFTMTDHTQCLHDHPNDLISFIFKNGYSEQYWEPKEKKVKVQVFKAPYLRKFPASHAHRVTLLDNKPAWSIVFMYPKKRAWGFWVTENGKRKWVSLKDYDDKYDGVGGCG